MTAWRIRAPVPADFGRIDEIVRAAFNNQEEVDIVRRARAEGSVLWEAVADLDGEVTGHILFTRMSADRPIFLAALGPVAIEPGQQSSGGGGALIRAGIEAMRGMGVDAIVLLGHQTYYPRFGFSPEAAAAIASPYAGSRSFMALELWPKALERPIRADFPPAFGPPPSDRAGA